MEKKPMRDFLGLFILCFLIWMMVPRCIQFVRIYQTYVYLKYVHFSVCIIYFYKMFFLIKKDKRKKRRKKREEADFASPSYIKTCLCETWMPRPTAAISTNTEGSRAGSLRTKLNRCTNLVSPLDLLFWK